MSHTPYQDEVGELKDMLVSWLREAHTTLNKTQRREKEISGGH